MPKKKSGNPAGPSWSPTKASEQAVRYRDQAVQIYSAVPAGALRVQEMELSTQRELFFGDTEQVRRYIATAMGASSQDASLDNAGLARSVLAAEVRALQAAEVVVVSPKMHAVVIAAALTVTPEDMHSLHWQDLPFSHGYVLLPQPLHTETSRTDALGWRPVHVDSQAEGIIDGVGFTEYEDVVASRAPDGRTLIQNMREWGYEPPRMAIGAHDRILRVNHLAEGLSEQDLLDGEQLGKELAQAEHQLHAGIFAQATGQDLGEWGESYEAELPAGFSRAYLFALWRLMQQKLASVQTLADATGKQKMSAAVRQRVGDVASVRVVQLRAVESGPATGTRDVAWKGRWVVRMHKRRQWYPSLGQHQIIWVGPFIKGPEDKPFLAGEKTYSVQR